MGKRIRYKYKDRKGIASLFNSKGYPRGKKGQPKINQDILIGLIAKIKMNKKNIKAYKSLKSDIGITIEKRIPENLFNKIKKNSNMNLKVILEECSIFNLIIYH